MNYYEASSESSNPVPDILVNQPAAFELGLCTTEEVLTPKDQAELTADLEQLVRERRLASAVLQSMHS